LTSLFKFEWMHIQNWVLRKPRWRWPRRIINKISSCSAAARVIKFAGRRKAPNVSGNVKPNSQMKSALVFLVIGIVLLAVLLSTLHIWRGASTIDIHVHDTMYVLPYTIFIFFILLILGTFFFLGGAIGTGFKNKYYLIPLFLFVLMDTYTLLNA
jgi:hypothetical protein